jgi:signal transduction histidine kinase/ActR/RegA family two-component response regulator
MGIVATGPSAADAVGVLPTEVAVDSAHVVQFYDDDTFLMESVTRFVGAALGAGDVGIVIATPAHRIALDKRLRARGVDLRIARRQGRYLALDAADTLSALMADGLPDADRFRAVVGRTIESAVDAGRRVRAFGEMVALLWEAGRRDAALRLEELWNELAERLGFALLCAYPMRGFGRETDGEPFLQVCGRHADVVPVESYTRLTERREQMVAIGHLQQRARALEAEVAERKRAESEREALLRTAERARSDAEAASRAKDEFLSVVSHELRTPLAAMLGWVSVLKTGAAGERAARALETIERSGRAQAKLIEDLLDVSRIVSGGMRLDLRLVDLPGVIREALDTIRPTAEVKGVRLVAHVDASAGPVAGDADRLQQVAWNLLSNAVKFTPAGGHVEACLERRDDEVRFVVRDTGRGIAADFLPFVFERFRQADTSVSRRTGGLGLGLAIVRHLVELHGGAVGVASAGEGQGAEFTITLPLTPLRVDAARTGRSPRLLAGLDILVVDDDVDTQESLRLLLEGHGAQVVTAGSVGEAREALRRLTPDVVVSDIGLPDEDGYALVRELRATDRLRPIPAIAITGRDAQQDAGRAVAAGYQVRLDKPVDLELLVAAIAQLTVVRGGTSSSGRRP